METIESIPISALEHWSYCPRQCCLIHSEQVFAENVHTLRGRAVHARVDDAGVESRPGLRVARSVPLWSDRLGLVGRADVVEILADGTLYPVEYKHGRRRARHHDDLQLAAQALCLEEMKGRSVPYGAIYHATSRRRREVEISDELRQAAEDSIVEIRSAFADATLPPAVDDERCRACSLAELCQPKPLAARRRQREMAASLFLPDDFTA